MADLRGYVEGLIGFEGDGTNVVANPTGTPTDDLESVQIGETIYSVGGGGESIVPTPTGVDRGKYLGVKSNANELEYRSINELPNSEGASVGTVLTHTVSGDSWLPPVKELPTYTTGDNGKVLGVSSGTLAWVEQSGGGGGVIYSTDEQEIGTWIDGVTPVYSRTIYIPNPVMDSRTNIAIDINANLLIDIIGTVKRNVAGVGDLSYTVNCYESSNYYTYCVFDDYLNRLAYYIHFINSTAKDLIITVHYTKNTSSS